VILNNAINAGNFIYCTTYLSPHESSTYHNSGNGHYHQYTYVTGGTGIAEHRDSIDGPVTETRDVFYTGKIVDKSSTKDKFTKLETQEGVSLIFFNPVPDIRPLTIDIIHGPVTQTISAGSNRKTIVCITGPVTANGKELQSLQHAKIFVSKSAELIVPENAVCAIVYDTSLIN
jgi:hypothetical protein